MQLKIEKGFPKIYSINLIMVSFVLLSKIEKVPSKIEKVPSNNKKKWSTSSL